MTINNFNGVTWLPAMPALRKLAMRSIAIQDIASASMAKLWRKPGLRYGHTMKQATLFLVIVAMTTLHAQRDVQPQGRQAGIPRLADGRPDMQGIWQARSRAAYGLEDHPARY